MAKVICNYLRFRVCRIGREFADIIYREFLFHIANVQSAAGAIIILFREGMVLFTDLPVFYCVGPASVSGEHRGRAKTAGSRAAETHPDAWPAGRFCTQGLATLQTCSRLDYRSRYAGEGRTQIPRPPSVALGSSLFSLLQAKACNAANLFKTGLNIPILLRGAYPNPPAPFGALGSSLFSLLQAKACNALKVKTPFQLR